MMATIHLKICLMSYLDTKQAGLGYVSTGRNKIRTSGSVPKCTLVQINIMNSDLFNRATTAALS